MVLCPHLYIAVANLRQFVEKRFVVNRKCFVETLVGKGKSAFSIRENVKVLSSVMLHRYQTDYGRTG
mgnify:CR=1 FL=1